MTTNWKSTPRRLRKRRGIQLTLSDAAVARLTRAAKAAGASKSALVERLILSAFALLLASCELTYPPPRDHYTVQCNSNLPDPAVCWAAALAWQARAPGLMIDLVTAGPAQCEGDACIDVVSVPDIAALQAECSDANSQSLGYTTWGTGRWVSWILADLPSTDRQAVYEHEIGHGLSLVHEEGNILMNANIQFQPGTATPVNITDVDVAQYKRVRGL